ncbi:MAG: hypothetical protein IKD80_09755 [Selenomonadaceae bacterium]|nr:hypothetical protein [Selenomonadaceae bacterium]
MRKIFAAVIVFALMTCSSFARAAAVDIDLTKMSSTMIYSTVFNIVTTPKNFVGKTMRMRGEYTTYPISASETIHACLVRDGECAQVSIRGCCSQGIEFRLTGGKYPAGAGEITVVGTIDSFRLDGKEICYLRNAALE